MRRHDVDVLSLVAGLLFVGAALIWGVADDPSAALEGWPLPVLLIAVGLAGLLTSLTGWRRRSTEGSGGEPDGTGGPLGVGGPPAAP